MGEEVVSACEAGGVRAPLQKESMVCVAGDWGLFGICTDGTQNRNLQTGKTLSLFCESGNRGKLQYPGTTTTTQMLEVGGKSKVVHYLFAPHDKHTFQISTTRVRSR